MNPRVVGAMIVACLAIVVFLPTVTYDFLSWDDYLTLAKNSHFNPPPGESVDIGYYWANPHMDMYAPLTYTLWGLLAGQAHTETPDPDSGVTLNPMVFHAINVLLHVGAALVVLQILRLIFENEWVCVAGAALFAIHPLQVESVAWISGSKDVLAGALGLVAIWQYLTYAQGVSSGNVEGLPVGEPPPAATPVIVSNPETGEAVAEEEESKPIEIRISPIASFLIATVCFVLAMLAKPSAVAIPFLVIVLDLLVVRRRFADVIKPTIIWLLLTIPIFVIAWRAQPADYAESPILARPLVLLDALAFYLCKLLIPVRYAVDYGRSPQWLMASTQKYWTWLVPVALAVLSVATYRRFRWLAVGSLSFACALVPVLGLFRFDYQIFSTVADHYMYVAVLGASLVLSGLLSKARGEMWLRVAGVAIILLAIRSFAQVRTWASSESLFDHALDINPDSVAAHNSLGVLWSGRAEQFRQAAQRAYRERNAQAFERSNALASEADATSLSHYLVSARVHPNDPVTQFNLGNAMYAQRRFNEAREYYQKAIDNLLASPMPKGDEAKDSRRWQLTRYYFNLGNVHGVLKEPVNATEYFAKSVETIPTADAETNWGIALNSMGKTDDARAHFLRALAIDPNSMRAKERLFLLNSRPATTQSSTQPTSAASTAPLTQPATVKPPATR